MTNAATVFVHIPKTAGSAVNTALEGLVPAPLRFNVGGQGRPHYQGNFDFASLPREERKQYRLIYGHVEMFLLQAVPRPVFAFTILRDPVERMNSLYHYIRRNQRHHLHKTVTAPGMSLARFMEAGLWHEPDNGMTRRLSGVMGLDRAPYGGCPRQTLNVAKANLAEGLSFFGLQEQFEASMFLLGKALGTPLALPVRRANVTVAKPEAKGMSPDDAQAVMRYNGLDMALYDFARDHFRRCHAATLEQCRDEFAAYCRQARQDAPTACADAC